MNSNSKLQLKLDFSIVTIEERTEFVKQFFNTHPEFQPRAHELETITNYILYGKDAYIDKSGNYIPDLPPEKWSNMSARKEIEIPTKYKTWRKSVPASLDALIESPTFNEASLLNAVHQPTPRFEFDRAANTDIPTIDNLWHTIDSISARLKDDKLSTQERYILSHTLVEMRREQFTMRESYKGSPITPRAHTRAHVFPITDLDIDWEDPHSPCAVAPMGFYTPGDARFEDPCALARDPDDWRTNTGARHIIDFTNPAHISILIYHYFDLLTHAHEHPHTPTFNLAPTLDFYMSRTRLDRVPLHILEEKKLLTTNLEITRQVNPLYNKSYNPNYISTIYTRACAKIAATAARIADNYRTRALPNEFKKCASCNKYKRRNSYEFATSSGSHDGYTATCKDCIRARKESIK